jgi:hypothetical protein
MRQQCSRRNAREGKPRKPPTEKRLLVLMRPLPGESLDDFADRAFDAFQAAMKRDKARAKKQ